MVGSDYSGAVYDAWLASVCMPPSTLRQVLEHYGNASVCHEAFRRNDPEFSRLVSARFRELLQRNSAEETLQAFGKKMEKDSIHVMRIGEPEYPERLKELPDAPAILFYQGDPSCLCRKTLSMVGSRAASYDGRKAASRLAEELSRRGITVISGLAGGIDASAHSGCIEGGSPTIAVMGCGLDRVYPAENRPLRDRILSSGGILLSEYAPGEKPAGWHFPVRNRIIAGLSQALILMEARIRSGSMTSVGHALDQGKDVFVYPGDPSSAYFEGNHQLLREGGIYFTCADDILEDLGWLDNPFPVRQNIDCLTAAGPFSPEETSVIDALKPGALGFEELLNSTGMSPSVLLSTLTLLQINGTVESLPGKIYRIKQ